MQAFASMRQAGAQVKALMPGSHHSEMMGTLNQIFLYSSWCSRFGKTPVFILLGQALMSRVNFHCLIFVFKEVCSGGSKGGARDAPPGPKFFHFHAVFDQKIGPHTHFGSWRPPWGKSWIRHWFDTFTHYLIH